MEATKENLVSKWKLREPLYLKKKDKRYKKHKEQLKEYGFSDSETWSLDSVISEFILPRLIRFRQISKGHPGGMTEETWNAIIDQMIFAFDWSLNCEETQYALLPEKKQKENWAKYEVGMMQFAKYFRHLWW